MCDCSKKKTTQVQGPAKECGHQTKRGNKWCAKCAAAKGCCAHCGEQKTPAEPKK